MRLLPAAARVALRGGLDRGRRLGRPAHRDAYARRRRSELGARIETGRRVTGIRLGPSWRGDRRRDRRRADRDRAGRTPGSGRRWPRWWGRSRLGAGRPPAHRPRRRGRARAAARDAASGISTTRRLRQVGGRRDLFGGYEPNPVARWVDGVPWDHAGTPVPPDHERFAQLMDGAVRRFPFLRDAGVVALICHPDAMTPDGNPLLADARGAGAGRPPVSRSTASAGPAASARRSPSGSRGETEPRRDRLPRAGELMAYRDPRFAQETAPRGLPLLPPPLPVRRRRVGQAEAALAPARTAPRISAPVFGTKNGWERADFFEPGKPSRRPAPTSGRSGSRSRPGSSGSGWSTRPSASGSGSST